MQGEEQMRCGIAKMYPPVILGSSSCSYYWSHFILEIAGAGYFQIHFFVFKFSSPFVTNSASTNFTSGLSISNGILFTIPILIF